MKRAVGCALMLGITTLHAAQITSGSVVVGGGGSGDFDLKGTDFSVQGDFTFGSFPPAAFFVVTPGELVYLGGQVTGSDFGGGSGTVNGTIHPLVDFSGSLIEGDSSAFYFSSEFVRLAGPGVYTGTFTFVGGLCGSAAGIVCDISLHSLTGHGTVALLVVPATNPEGALSVTQVAYTFVPEPSMLPLTVIAAIAFGMVWRRRSIRTERLRAHARANE